MTESIMKYDNGSGYTPLYSGGVSNSDRSVMYSAEEIKNTLEEIKNTFAAKSETLTLLYANRTAIPSNADLNSYTTPGNYSATSTVAATLSHCPNSTIFFTLDVFAGYSSLICQRITAVSSGIEYFRYYNTSTSTWYRWNRNAQEIRGSSGGTSTALTLTTSGGTVTPSDGDKVIMKLTVAVTAGATLAIDSGTAYTIKTMSGETSWSGLQYAWITLVFSSTASAFILQGEGGEKTLSIPTFFSLYAAGTITGTMVAYNKKTDTIWLYDDSAGTVKSYNSSGTLLSTVSEPDSTANLCLDVSDNYILWSYDAGSTAVGKFWVTDKSGTLLIGPITNYYPNYGRIHEGLGRIFIHLYSRGHTIASRYLSTGSLIGTNSDIPSSSVQPAYLCEEGCFVTNGRANEVSYSSKACLIDASASTLYFSSNARTYGFDNLFANVVKM